MQADLHINFISLYASDEGKDFSGGQRCTMQLPSSTLKPKRKKKALIALRIN